MTGRLGAWFAFVLFLTFAATLLGGPWLRPEGWGTKQAAPPRHPAVAASTDPPPPDATPDPFHPSWTPPDGRWMMAEMFGDVARRHPVMYALGAV